jgi:hypothetical protein
VSSRWACSSRALGRSLQLLVEVDVADLGLLDVEDVGLGGLGDRLLDRLRLGGLLREHRGRILATLLGQDVLLAGGRRLFAGLELGVTGAGDRPEHLLLELV